MKSIGLLGGTAWPSTIGYYRQLNQLAQEKLGPTHSAEILLKSIDYHRLKQFYPDRWDDVANELYTVLVELDKNPLACILICNNALHKAFDLIGLKKTLRARVIHIVDAAIDLLRQSGSQRPLLLATKFTMEDSFYISRLSENGFNVIIPNAVDREQIHSMQTQLSSGVEASTFKASFESICAHYKTCDAVLLACTELPMVFQESRLAVPILDPSKRQCEIAFECAVGG